MIHKRNNNTLRKYQKDEVALNNILQNFSTVLSHFNKLKTNIY